MGNKSKLLECIIPEIEKLTDVGDVVCDIMAGTNSISYALKERNFVISNDIQYYSYIVSKCLMRNYSMPSLEEMHVELDGNYNDNKKSKEFSFFVDNYVDTYFSYEQCVDIDCLRYAIENVLDPDRRALYLTLLMNTMCKAQSTTGHFAQFIDKNHKRAQELRKKSIYDLFFDKIKDFGEFVQSDYDGVQTNLDYKILFESALMNDVKCFYLDSPYTSDQYSRFYHVLETVCKYDNPQLNHKAKYRSERYLSDFCYKKSVSDAFEHIISFCRSKNASLVISYSNHGVISVDSLMSICQKHYDNVDLKTIDFEHSSQGSGTIGIQEIIIVMK